MTPERLAEIRNNIGPKSHEWQGIGIARELLTEVDRLRAALAVVADPAMWERYTRSPWEWIGTGEYADPIAWATKIQERSEDARD